MLQATHYVKGTDAPVVVAVASDRSLIADAVAAALSTGGFHVVRLPWPGERGARETAYAERPPTLALMLSDLSPGTVQSAQSVIADFPARWVLLTDAPRGPLWGAMLEAGVVRVMSSTATLTDLLAVITSLVAGSGPEEQPDREELVSAWRHLLPERALARAGLASLTARERDVLHQLYEGRTVQEIAVAHDVAVSTVRSQVRSVLRKLGVTSQLAAVAHYDRWAEH